MALTQKQRDERTTLKRQKAEEEEEELRLSTKQVLRDLMAWAGIEEQGEAMTLMLHHLHAMGYAKCHPLLNPPRHGYEPPQIVAREFLKKACWLFRMIRATRS